MRKTLRDCSATTCPSWNLITAWPLSPVVTVAPLAIGMPLEAALPGACGVETVTYPVVRAKWATGAAIAIDTGNAARTSHASMSFFRLRICVFTSRVTSLECEKAGRFAPGGPPGLLDTRARLLVWHSL